VGAHRLCPEARGRRRRVVYHRDLPAEGPASVDPDRVTNHSEPTAGRRLEPTPAEHRALVPIRKQERALKKLGPPKDNQAIGLAFIGSIVSTRRALEQVVAGLAAGDEAAVRRGSANAGAAGARTRTYAQQLGLVSCGAPRSS
jgi:hypothetical protein